MELKVEQIAIPEHIEFNFEEIKQELALQIEKYTTMAYTDDQLKQAKADKANLNKLKKALNEERLRREREYMQPFNEFKAQINELIAIIDKPIGLIDTTLKEADEKRKAEKKEQIIAIFNENEGAPIWLDLDQIANDKWLNVSVSLASIKSEIEQRIADINADLKTLAELPEFGFEATEVYKKCLGINQAITEAKRMAEIEQAKKDAQKEEQKPEEKPQPANEGFMNPPRDENSPRQWVSFSAYITVEEAKDLKGFFDRRNILIKPAKEI